jgi:hypothetical protein
MDFLQYTATPAQTLEYQDNCSSDEISQIFSGFRDASVCARLFKNLLAGRESGKCTLSGLSFVGPRKIAD